MRDYHAFCVCMLSVCVCFLHLNVLNIQPIFMNYAVNIMPGLKNNNTSIFSPIINPLKPELNPICYLLALLGAHHFLHVSRIRVKLLTLR